LAGLLRLNRLINLWQLPAIIALWSMVKITHSLLPMFFTFLMPVATLSQVSNWT
jgi:hypothetical protein